MKKRYFKITKKGNEFFLYETNVPKPEQKEGESNEDFVIRLKEWETFYVKHETVFASALDAENFAKSSTEEVVQKTFEI